MSNDVFFNTNVVKLYLSIYFLFIKNDIFKKF